MKDTSIFSREEWAIIGDSLYYYRERIESLLWLNETLDGGVTEMLDMLSEIIAVVHEQF